MTTNKPEVVAWLKPASDATLNSVDAVITDRSMQDRPEVTTMGFKEPLVRLADYEALQAENAQLRAAIRRLCNIYAVDDYYDGHLREERLEAAVNRAINAAKESSHE